MHLRQSRFFSLLSCSDVIPRPIQRIQGYDATETLLNTYGVDIIVGPACCSAAARASLLAERRGVPVISWACSADFLSDKVDYELRFLTSLGRKVARSEQFSRRH